MDAGSGSFSQSRMAKRNTNATLEPTTQAASAMKSRLRSSSKCSMSVTTLRPDEPYALGALAVPAGGLRRLGGGLSSALRRRCRDGRGLGGLVVLLDVLAHVPDPLAELADG